MVETELIATSRDITSSQKRSEVFMHLSFRALCSSTDYGRLGREFL